MVLSIHGLLFNSISCSLKKNTKALVNFCYISEFINDSINKKISFN